MGESTPAKISIGASAFEALGTEFTGGLYFTAYHHQSNRTLTRRLVNGQTNIELINGTWDMTVIGWTSQANPFEGDMKCDVKNNIELDGGEITIVFSPTILQCGKPKVGSDKVVFKEANGQPKAVRFHTCNGLGTDIENDVAFLPATFCESATEGHMQSYKVALFDAPFSLRPMLNRVNPLQSTCYVAGGNKFIDTALRLPIGHVTLPTSVAQNNLFRIPMVIKAYENNDCSGPHSTHFFGAGLGGGDKNLRGFALVSNNGNFGGSPDSHVTVYLDSHIPTNNPPFVGPLVPPNGTEDQQSIVTLSYSELDGDLASSCSVSNLNNLTVTQACACDGGGTCTVGVTGLPDYSGPVSFSYNVTANGQQSNTETASFNLNPIDDAPVALSMSGGSVDNSESTAIVLTYSDPEGDLATACSVANLNGLTIGGACNCDGAGVCTVNVIGLSDVKMIGSFDYTVTANGTMSNLATVTVDVDVPFVSTWQTATSSETVTLPLRANFNYNFIVDWGDGTNSEITSPSDPDKSHVYATPATYTIKIKGIVEAWYFNNGPSKDQILTVVNLGDVGWINMNNAFYGCTNLTAFAGGNMANVTDMSGMFWGATAVTPITTGWDTSSATNMSQMFRQAAAANPNTSTWNTSNVTNMTSMFSDTTLANPDTSGWDTSNVTSMAYMFMNASSANPNTSSWNTTNVTSMIGMFYNASSANPVVTNWDTSNVLNMTNMFKNAIAANPDVSGWDTSSVVNMSGLFEGASSANPDVTNWNVSNVTNMQNMFFNAISADPDTSLWNVANVNNMGSMFINSSLSQANYDAFLVMANNTTAQTAVTLDSSSTYTSVAAVAAARANLVANGWTITDAGPN